MQLHVIIGTAAISEFYCSTCFVYINQIYFMYIRMYTDLAGLDNDGDYYMPPSYIVLYIYIIYICLFIQRTVPCVWLV